jgi:hypothetical protein
MKTVGEYLHLPSDYCETFGDFRWSADAECVEYPDGGTFVFRQELILFLAGFGSSRPLVHFPCLLHLLHLLGRGRARYGGGEGPPGRVLPATSGTAVAPSTGTAELCRAFARAGQPLHQAGILCAVLCKDFPAPAASPDLSEVVCLLATGLHLTLSGVGAEAPPLAPSAFEARVARALGRYTPEDLDHWLRHGTGTVKEAAGQLAHELLARKPPSLGDILGELGRRERLAGAVSFVAQLAGALSLPPRRLDRQEMPLGGYADVATRGHPEQILPSQFALDGPEFIRRFAENELLFFRREEPQERTREELVLLLDQGVRTWGTVRVLLAAAVLALGQRADRRGLPFFIATTGGDGRPLDPLKTDPAALGQAVEASDLSPHPGIALERVLEERPGCERDVVLLTHPRNLAEPDVAAAARRVARGTRLFGLTATETGEVRLSELRHGTPVELSRFRVDLSRPTEAPPPEERADTTVAGPWGFDVEKVPFPFRFGLAGHQRNLRFDFDPSGEWLLTASDQGMLLLQRTDGSEWELLPRGVLNQVVLSDVRGVVGVTGGFAVGGIVSGRLVLMHYDLARRSCTAHDLGEARGLDWDWHYFQYLHTVTARSREKSCALDLSQGDFALLVREEEGTSSLLSGTSRPVGSAVLQSRASEPTSDSGRVGEMTRAAHALARLRERAASAPWLPIESGNQQVPAEPYLRFTADTGTVEVLEPKRRWVTSFCPTSDGRPMLRGQSVRAAMLQSDTLALLVSSSERAYQLHLFRGPDGVPLRTFQAPWPLFQLSANGRLLARQVAASEVEVRDLTDGTIHCSTPRGCFHNSVRVELGHRWLWMQIEQYTHLIEWDKGKLAVTSWHPGKGSARSKEAKPALPGVGVAADAAMLHRIIRHLGHDHWRFVSAAVHSLIAVADRFGQVALLGPGGELVCMFFAFRLGVAAWMPDGTCLGPRALLGRSPTPGADAKIGAALRDGGNRGGRASAP